MQRLTEKQLSEGRAICAAVDAAGDDTGALVAAMRELESWARALLPAALEELAARRAADVRRRAA